MARLLLHPQGDRAGISALLRPPLFSRPHEWLARPAGCRRRRDATDATPAPTSDNQSDFLFGGEVAALPSLLPACSFASYSSSAAESLLACELIATCSTIE